MEEDDAGAYLEETKDYGGDLCRGTFEAAEKDGRGDDGGGGEVDVVGWCYEGCVENIESFLFR